MLGGGWLTSHDITSCCEFTLLFRHDHAAILLGLQLVLFALITVYVRNTPFLVEPKRTENPKSAMWPCLAAFIVAVAAEPCAVPASFPKTSTVSRRFFGLWVPCQPCRRKTFEAPFRTLVSQQVSKWLVSGL